MARLHALYVEKSNSILGGTGELLNLDALRQLRLDHWRAVLFYSEEIRKCSGGTETLVGIFREWHARHMRAVQALNDLFPVGDTAEKDDAEGWVP